jgi:hypothetical protein
LGSIAPTFGGHAIGHRDGTRRGEPAALALLLLSGVGDSESLRESRTSHKSSSSRGRNDQHPRRACSRESVSSVLLSMKVFAVRHRTNSPWRACAIFACCLSSRSRGTFGVRTACPPCAGVLASLLGEKAVDRKAMRRRLALPKHFVQDAVDAFRPIHIRVISEPSCGNSETEGKPRG